MSKAKPRTRLEEITEEMERQFVAAIQTSRSPRVTLRVVALAKSVAEVLADHEERIVKLASKLDRLRAEYDGHGPHYSPYHNP